MTYVLLIIIIFCQWWGHRTQRQECKELKEIRRRHSVTIKHQSKEIVELRDKLGISKTACVDVGQVEYLQKTYEERIGKLTVELLECKKQIKLYEIDLRERWKEMGEE